MTDNENQKDKIFFITSNQSALDKLIKYSLSKAEGMSNLTLILAQNYENEEFFSKVFCFEISQEEIKQQPDIESTKFKAKIILNYNKTDFEGIILFKEDKKNYFIYNFKFNDYKNFFLEKLLHLNI